MKGSGRVPWGVRGRVRGSEGVWQDRCGGMVRRCVGNRTRTIAGVGVMLTGPYPEAENKISIKDHSLSLVLSFSPSPFLSKE